MAILNDNTRRFNFCISEAEAKLLINALEGFKERASRLQQHYKSRKNQKGVILSNQAKSRAQYIEDRLTKEVKLS